MRFGLIALALLLPLVGCSNGPRLGELKEPLVVEQRTELPAPSGADLVPPAQPGLIGPLDKLTIHVFGVEEMSGEVQVDASGRVSVPLAGEIIAAGKTPNTVATEVQGRLSKYLRDPQVTVNMKEAVSQNFTVDGQVVQPGVYQIVGKMSLIRAIATARGLTEYARADDVVIFRTVGGQPMAALYNLSAIRLGTYADPTVYANDIVMVGDSKSRRLFKDLLQVTPALATPLVLLLQ